MIRFFIHFLPLSILATILISFLNATTLHSSRKNEMSIGLMGEPSTLNPIKQADSASSAVAGAIFNGLLKYDENLNIIPDLAESYSLSQNTTFLFRDEDAALSALLSLLSNQQNWESWKILSAHPHANALTVRLSEPGVESSKKILASFNQPDLIPLQILRLEAPTPIPPYLLNQLTPPPLRTWQENPSTIEFTLPGTPTQAQSWAKQILAQIPDASIRTIESLPFLAEPEIHFVLRKNVRWHDGSPFTSADPAFTYRAIMDEAVASPRKPDFNTILHVTTPSPHHFIVTYRRPYSPALTSWMIPILPAHILQDKDQSWWVANYDRKPIGTGPFLFAQWKTNQFIRVTRNPHYHLAPAPWLDAIVFHHLSDQLALRLAFETRQTDFWAVDPWAVRSFQNDPRFQLFSMPGNSYTYVGWNLRRKPFDNPKVRRALAHAVNIPQMLEFILYSRGTQSTGIFTPQMWFFDPSIQPIAYNPQKARQLLAEEGWIPGPDGTLTKNGTRFSFTLITNSGNEIRRDIATLIQDDLRKIGIETRIETYEWAVFLRNFVNKAHFDAVVLGWALGLDYDQFQIWHSSQTNPEQLNFVGYQNQKVDQLLETIRQEYNRQTIINLASQIQSTIYNDQPYLFLFVPESITVLWKNSYRIRRPAPDGSWLDSPIQMTKAGWSHFSDFFYRSEFSKNLPAAHHTTLSQESSPPQSD